MPRGKIVFSADQIAFLLNDEAKRLTPKAAAAVKRDEAYERFKAIRWGWQQGYPHCPYCDHERPYELADRNKFTCRKCARQFSVTTRTAFSARKMPFTTILRVLAIKLHAPMNSLQLAGELGVAYDTARRANAMLAPYVGNINPNSIRVSDVKWPFRPIADARVDNGADLVEAVHKLLPRALPEQVRADVGQDIILGVLEGHIDRSQLQAQVASYIRRHYGNFEWKFNFASLDQKLFEDGGSLHDLIDSTVEHF